MAHDATYWARSAIIRALKTDANVTSLVAASSIYPGTTPATVGWPFLKTGVFIVNPFRASCLDGNATNVNIYGFAKSVPPQSAEDIALSIGNAVMGALDGLHVDLSSPFPAKIDVTWVQNQATMDGSEAGAWRSISTFSINVIA